MSWDEWWTVKGRQTTVKRKCYNDQYNNMRVRVYTRVLLEDKAVAVVRLVFALDDILLLLLL